MNRFGLACIAMIVFSSAALAENGLISIQSAHDVKTTADRLESSLTSKGMTLFNRIDHAAAARKVDKTLRPTELVLFGNPKVGTPLMQCGQSVAIELPLKALIYEDESGQVWLAYNDPVYLARRHSITGCIEVIRKMSGALGNFAKQATMP
ncbi:MAG: DUF302 domain-containing protein [Halopseudomonas sp.]